MIIFLYGEDSYRSRQKLDEIISQYKAVRKSGLSLIDIDASQVDFSEYYHQLCANSMFVQRKLFIVKNLFSSKSFQGEFLEKIPQMKNLEDVVVIYQNDAPDARLKIYKELKKHAKSQEFSLLDAKHTKAWAAKEFEAQKQKINLDALDLMVAYTGSDTWRLSGEIAKLVQFKNGAPIKKDDVALLVKPSFEVDIFKTIDALAQRNRFEALSFIQKHLDAGESPLYILSMIAFQFRNLLVVKQLAQKGLMYDSIVKKSGLHPFVVKKNYFQCNQFSFEDFARIYQAIFKTDNDIKTGAIEPEAALDILVSKI